MARFSSPVYSTASGSIAGFTLSPTKGPGLLIRSKPVSTRKTTNRQTQLRSSWSGAVARWSSLTAADQTGWNNYAKSLTYSDHLGPHDVSGRNVFLSNISFELYMINRNVHSGSFNTNPPKTPGDLKMGVITIQPWDLGGIGIKFIIHNPNTFQVSSYHWRSAPQSPARAKAPTKFKSSPLVRSTILPDMTLVQRFAFPQIGVVIFFKIRCTKRNSPTIISPIYQIRAVSGPQP